MRRLRSFAFVFAFLTAAAPGRAADGYGKLSGVVLDAAGNPQMGATVWLDVEAAGRHSPVQLFTDQNGLFTGQHLRPGYYSVKATLAGFLPTVRQHVGVDADATTVVRIELDSVFTSLDTLRRSAPQPAEKNDWSWVLRTSSATRPVFQFRDGSLVVANNDGPEPAQHQPHARVEMTSGSSEPGSSSARAGSLATTVSYDQSLGQAGTLLLAGRFQYPGSGSLQDSMGGSVASVWVPSGDLGSGPETTVVLRQFHLGPESSVISMRAMRAEHTERLALTERLAAEYGGEYVMGGIGDAMTSTIRPHARVTMRVSPSWTAAVFLATNPDAEGLWTQGPELQSAMGALDTLPVLVWNNGHASLEGGWHEEFAARRKLGTRASLEGAAFHDYSSHQAVFGIDPGVASPLGLFSTPWAQDAGRAGSWGTRVVYREKISEHLEFAAIYTWAGTLAPAASGADAADLSQILTMRYRHSAAARVAGKVPKTRTELTASYKWLDGIAVSRQDLFGEAALGIDPNLSLTIRQPLPFSAGHWEALADFRNVLAQGYTSVEYQGGQLLLMPVERSFRGGVSVQF